MLEINPQEESQKITDFIKNVFARADKKRGIIGLSGGIDSAVSCCLVARAIGKENVFPLLMPCNGLGKDGAKRAGEIITFLRVPNKSVQTINIKSAVERLAGHDSKITNLRKGNIMARVRMIYLFDRANKLDGLVIGTENKSEHLLGYYTRHGDEASDIEPIISLFKTQVYQLAEYLKIPPEIINQDPSADLWQGQTDEGELGFSYAQADPILFLYFDKKQSINDIVKKGFDRGLAQKIIIRAKKNTFKHKLPYKIED